MSEGISLLMASEGKAATIDYLVDLAARISAES